MKIYSKKTTQTVKTITLKVAVEYGTIFEVTVQSIDGKLNPKYGIDGFSTDNMIYLNRTGPRERRKHFKQMQEYLKNKSLTVKYNKSGTTI